MEARISALLVIVSVASVAGFLYLTGLFLHPLQIQGMDPILTGSLASP
jgi:hypothetical protein